MHRINQLTLFINLSPLLMSAASSAVNVLSPSPALVIFWQQALTASPSPVRQIHTLADLLQEGALSRPEVEETVQPQPMKPATVKPSAEVIRPAEEAADHLAERPATQVQLTSPELKSPELKPTAVSLVQRLKQGLSKTRQQLSFSNLFTSQQQTLEGLLTALETQLLMADVGMAATEKLLASVRQQANKTHLQQPELLKSLLRDAMLKVFVASNTAALFNGASSPKPWVVMMVGVNGVGKTTTLGKLSKHLSDQGQQILLAAGDTFRAAAIEQLQVWGQRHQIPVVAQQPGADAAAVVFDAISRAKARQLDGVLIDTAGRLHNKAHLMDELAKMVRVIKKHDTTAPHAVLLVVDATTGQNAVHQAKTFQELIGVTGIVLTKLDGTAKGGIAFALAEQLQLPICYIGVGEQVDDLKPFVAADFVDALLG